VYKKNALNTSALQPQISAVTADEVSSCAAISVRLVSMPTLYPTILQTNMVFSRDH